MIMCIYLLTKGKLFKKWPITFEQPPRQYNRPHAKIQESGGKHYLDIRLQYSITNVSEPSTFRSKSVVQIQPVHID